MRYGDWESSAAGNLLGASYLVKEIVPGGSNIGLQVYNITLDCCKLWLEGCMFHINTPNISLRDSKADMVPGFVCFPKLK